MESLDFKKTLTEVKKKITLRQVMESYGVKINGKKLITCIFHQDSTPSMHTYMPDSENGSWYCFAGCGGGDLLNFVQKYENKTPIEALNSLCARLNINPVTRESENYLVNSLQDILNPKETPKLDMSKFFEASLLAGREFDELGRTDLTPYMLQKKINHMGTKSKGSLLVVPVCSESGNIWSLQYIAPNGGKWFMENGKKNGGMFRLGDEPKDLIFICEGYSTAYSVFISTQITTYVCFTAGNIKNVYSVLQERHPNCKVVVAGDNDAPGKRHGIISSIYPEKEGEDWNDLYLSKGAEEVKKQILGGLRG